MTNSKLRFGFPLAVLLAAASTGAVAKETAVSGDAQLKANVVESLDRHAELRAPNLISVETRGGVVYLNGEVSAGQQSEAAQTVAERTPGVARVVNSISISRGG
jgi:osmotically-inducible protein OsmY